MTIPNLRELLYQAALGSRDALEQFIYYYEEGIIADEDNIEVFKNFFLENTAYLKDNPNFDNPNFLFMWAFCLYHGLGVKADFKAAAHYLNMPFMQNNVYVMWLKADIFYTQGNNDTAAFLFKKALEKDENNVRIMVLLSYVLAETGDTEGISKIIEKLKTIAPSKGWYVQGSQLLFEKKYTEAIESLDKAITCNDIQSIKLRALMLIEGLGGEPDASEALKLYELGALQGDCNCAIEAGEMYKKGIGCEKNHNKAREYYTRALNLAKGSVVRSCAEDYLNELNELEEEQIKKKYISTITKLLKQFQDGIYKNKAKHDPAAQEKAEELLVTLTKYTKIFENALTLSGLKNESMRHLAIKQFRENCQSSIAKAKPFLEQDLSLSQKLENLWIGFKNFFITIGQYLGIKGTLFAPNESELTKAVKNVEDNLPESRGPSQ